MKKNQFLPTEVQSFQMQGTNDYHNILQLMQEQVQKIDYCIRENDQKIALIEQEIEDKKEVLSQEKKEIQPEVQEILSKLKGLPKTKETLSERKRLKKQKNDLQEKSISMKTQILYTLPNMIQLFVDSNLSNRREKEQLLKEIEKVATNPISFCQTMKEKVGSILSNTTFSQSHLSENKDLEKQSRYYSNAVIEALKIASLPVDTTKFNIVERGPSGGKVASNMIPYWKDGGGTYNEM